jgi:hypothetical protein
MAVKVAVTSSENPILRKTGKKIAEKIILI